MKQTLIILTINILYVVLLLNHPKSNIYKLHKKSDTEILEQNNNFASDTDSYTNFDSNTPKRTVGYPYLIKAFQLFDNWYLGFLMFNCALGAWMFYVAFSMIGKWAYLLACLGVFTAYVPFFYTDMLFAALFMSAIWMLKQKRILSHFVLLGIASLVRPSLAWFFIIEPLVLYAYGYRGWIVYCSVIICFLVTSFSPTRNYVKFGRFIHSDILEHNQKTITPYFYSGSDNKVVFFMKSFKSTAFAPHYEFIGILFNRYKRDLAQRKKSILMWWLNIVGVIGYFVIWCRFGYRVLRKQVNWDNALIVAYFIAPTLFAIAGGRLRLPIEFLLFI